MEAQGRRNIRYVLLAGVVFGACMGACIYGWTGSGYYAFHGGFLSGFAFALATAAFLRVSMTTTHLELDGRAAGFDEDEKVLRVGPANHFKGLEGVGGKLFLTNRRLRFRSHKINFQSHDESYPIETIASVEPASSLGIIPNGLLVHMRDGRRERFVVTSRAAWVSSLRSVLSPAAEAPLP
ncbi:MAG TPA: hypothetical protein VF765_19370 [Polyangiaceae bacterium]